MSLMLRLVIMNKYYFAAKSGKTNCVVKDVLFFCSGAERFPPLGFGKELKILFLGHQDGKLATASMCDLTLRLPTVHGEDYESFKDCMTMSFKGNDGFGGV